MDNQLQQELLSLQKALSFEKKQEAIFYKDSISKKTVQERVESGLSLYPLEAQNFQFGLGQYPILTLTSQQALNNRFSTGKSVELFSCKEGHEPEKTIGVLLGVQDQQIIVQLQSDDHPDWLKLGKIGASVTFDARSYEEMEYALKACLEEQIHTPELLSILFGIKQSTPSHNLAKTIPDHLNDSQINAVNAIFSNQDISIIHGPPGTGKTTTLVAATKLLIDESKEKILISTPSNAAADHVTNKLGEIGISVVRLGNVARVDQKIYEHTLDGKIEGHPDKKLLKQLKKQSEELYRLAGKYKRNFGKEEAEQRKRIYQEARSIKKDIIRLEKGIIDQLLTSADVIVATLVGSSHKYLKNKTFDTVIIDEAGQCLTPGLLIPLRKAKRLVLAGDPHQLSPVVMSKEAIQNGLSESLLSKLIHQPSLCTLLDRQYRMNQLIMEFSNQKFYDGKLIADESVKDAVLENTEKPAFEMIDTAGCGFEETINSNRSIINKEEAKLVNKHYLQLISENKNQNIGIIAPYKAQSLYLKELIEDHPFVSINTVDSFQGQERDIIYISLVRSNENGIIGFLKDYRRMNVAMTRAKKKLVIIGDSSTFGSDSFFRDLFEYAEKNECYFSAWEWMYTE